MKLTQNYLQELYLIDNLNLIQEGLGDFVKRNMGDKAKELASKLKNVKDVNTFKKITNHIPKLGPKKSDELAKKHIPNYEKKKQLASKEFNKVPSKIKAPLCSIVAIAAQDENQLRVMAKQINRQVIDWEQINANLLSNILVSIVISGFFSLITGGAFVAFMALCLCIDFIFYLLDIAMSPRIEVAEGSYGSNGIYNLKKHRQKL